MSKQEEQRCKFFRQEDDYHPQIESKEFSGKKDFAAQHFYCIKTMTISGPDHEPVGPEECAPGRRCFITE